MSSKADIKQRIDTGNETPASGFSADVVFQKAILACVLFIVVWAPLAYGATGPAAFLVIQGTTILAVALWAVRWWVQRPFRLLWPPVCWGVLAFLFYALARCQLVEVEFVGREQLTRVIVYVALFFVVLNNLNRRETATIVAMSLVIVGFCLSFASVVQFARHSATIWGLARPAQYLTRGSATFINPNNFAGYLEMIIPLALAYVITSRFGAITKVLLAYSVLAMLAGAVTTLSRGGTVAIAVTLVLFCIALLTQRDFWLPGLVTLAVLGVVGLVILSQSGSLQRRFEQGIRTEKADPSIRLDYWQAARQLYARSPIWGIGPGHYEVEFGLVRPFRVQNRPEYAHNDYLNLLCEWGAVGMGIAAATCGLLAWGAARTWRAVRRPVNEFGSGKGDRTAFVMGACAGLVAVMIHCTVDFNMQIPGDAITAVILMGLIAAQGRFVTEGYWKNPGMAGKVVLTLLAMGTVYWLALEGIHRGKETYWLRRAGCRGTSADEALLCLKRAHESEPANPETDYLLGESLRLASKDGNPGYQGKARQAINWYSQGMNLDRFDARFPLRVGMCLDWIGQPQAASPYFNLAEGLDTNNFYIALEEGRHCVALGDFDKAQYWVWRSLELKRTPEATETLRLLLKNAADPLFLPQKESQAH